MALPEMTVLDEAELKGLKKGRAEGRVEGARRMLLRQLELRFGPPSDATRGRVRAIDSVDELERLGERLLTARTVQEVVGAPGGGRASS